MPRNSAIIDRAVSGDIQSVTLRHITSRGLMAAVLTFPGAK
jgi:hypothetical protein